MLDSSLARVDRNIVYYLKISMPLEGDGFGATHFGELPLAHTHHSSIAYLVCLAKRIRPLNEVIKHRCYHPQARLFLFRVGLLFNDRKKQDPYQVVHQTRQCGFVGLDRGEE